MGLRAFGAIGDLGLSMFWSLGQTGPRMVGTKGPFEAQGHMAYMGFSTFGVPLFTIPYHYHSILAYSRPILAILFHTMPYYSIPYHALPFHTCLFYTMPYRYYSMNRDTRYIGQYGSQHVFVPGTNRPLDGWDKTAV